LELSRRHFLKTSAAVGAAFLGLKHLGGCSGPAMVYEPMAEFVRDASRPTDRRCS
jgi:hypothetical protein